MRIPADYPKSSKALIFLRIPSIPSINLLPTLFLPTPPSSSPQPKLSHASSRDAQTSPSHRRKSRIWRWRKRGKWRGCTREDDAKDERKEVSLEGREGKKRVDRVSLRAKRTAPSPVNGEDSSPPEGEELGSGFRKRNEEGQRRDESSDHRLSKVMKKDKLTWSPHRHPPSTHSKTSQGSHPARATSTIPLHRSSLMMRVSISSRLILIPNPKWNRRPERAHPRLRVSLERWVRVRVRERERGMKT